MIFAVLLGVVLGLASNVQAQTNCISYYVGNVLYTSCNGQPGTPAKGGGIDPSIPLAVKPPQIESAADWMLKAQQLRLLQQQSDLLEAQRQATQKNPQSPVGLNPRSAMAAADVGDLMAAEKNGEWWNAMRKLAVRSEAAQYARIGFVMGALQGADLLNVLVAKTHEEYTQKRATFLRDDLTLDQLFLKLDGYYAEPGNTLMPLNVAILIAMKRPTDDK